MAASRQQNAPNQNKLRIIRGKYSGTEAKFSESDDTTLTVDFNPTEYSIDKGNAYSEATIPGLDSPLIQFTHGNVRTLSLELLLDSHTYAKDGKPKDLRKTLLPKIDKMLVIDSELHAPPPCKVLWGSLEFVGVLQDAKKRFVLFLREGFPVRARVTLTFKEYVPVEIQLKENPRSSPDRRRMREFLEGDSLWKIAHDVYGNVAHWNALAVSNNVEDPLRIEPGRRLIIPPIDELVTRKQ